MPPTSFALDGHTFTVHEQLRKGLLCNFYRVEYESGTGAVNAGARTAWERLSEDDAWATAYGVAKMTREAGNNDLAEHDREMVTRIFPDAAKDEGFRRYLPRLLAHGQHEGKAVLVFPFYQGLVSMYDVKRAYPNGLDYQDVVWQWKRCLAALWYIHEQGLINGAMTPDNIFVHPIEHGAKLMEWSFATPTGRRVGAADAGWADFVAPEVFRKLEAHPATDIYMLSKCVLWLLGGDVKTNVLPPTVPEALQEFLAPCLQENRAYRPNDAGDLHEKLDQILLRVVGKPRYRRLVMPGI